MPPGDAPTAPRAEQVVLPQQQAVPLPDGVPTEVGACLGIPALTALHAVLTDGGVAGQRVLVAGGAGAVGHYAIQFARLTGRGRGHHHRERRRQGGAGARLPEPPT